MPSSFRAICRTSETQPINQTVGESDHLGALMVGLFDVLVGWVFCLSRFAFLPLCLLRCFLGYLVQ
jgi:hypothetical protein